jgi:hypothetical protein
MPIDHTGYYWLNYIRRVASDNVIVLRRVFISSDSLSRRLGIGHTQAPLNFPTILFSQFLSPVYILERRWLI